MPRLWATGWLLARAFHEARVPFAPIETIERIQRRRIRRMLRHALRDVPHYREALQRVGASPDDIRSAADLARLPVIGREDLQRRPDAFASQRHRVEACVTLRSGGSTGAPRGVAHDVAAVLANAAHGERERSIVARHVGRRAGYREAVLAPPFGAAQVLQELVLARTRLPARLRVRRAYFSMLDDPGDVAGKLEAFRPHVVHGYGSYVGAVFRRLAETAGALPGLRAVTYSSDPMAPADLALVAERFRAPVLSTYQAVEALKIAFACGQAEGLHVNVDLYPLRIVDEEGRDAPPGTPGTVIVSNLVNRATVLLQYRLGDRATWLAGPCPCGRTLPRMSLPIGRDEEWIGLPGGGRLHGQAIRTLFTDETSIHEYQVVQEGPRRFAVALVGASDADRASTAARVRKKFADRLGSGVEVAVTWVGALERTPGGKARPIVRRWR